MTKKDVEIGINKSQKKLMKKFVFMFQVLIEKSRTSYTLTGLEEYQEYSFRIVANNANGAGVSTEEIVARTFSDAPSDVPQNFTLETASSTVRNCSMFKYV